MSIDDISSTADNYVKELNNSKTKIQTKSEKKNELKQYQYKSEFDTIGKTEIEIASINFENARDDYNNFVNEAGELTDELVSEINEKLKGVQSLEKVLKLIEVKEQINELQKELNNGLYSGVKDIASSAQRLYEAFKAVGETINDVDASGWEQFLSI